MNPRIYHMTHISNLPRILSEGRLWSDTQAASRRVTQQGIGHAHIKQRRAKTVVHVCQGGNLCDYVPFYFYHHTPMLYAIHKNHVDRYSGGQAEVVYLISHVERVHQAGLAYFFTDGHAALKISQQYAHLDGLEKLDWTAIEATYWKKDSDDDFDPDFERRKQAEFLVHDSFPFEVVEGIGVMNHAMAQRVEQYLASHLYQPKIKIVRNWYY